MGELRPSDYERGVRDAASWLRANFGALGRTNLIGATNAMLNEMGFAEDMEDALKLRRDYGFDDTRPIRDEAVVEKVSQTLSRLSSEDFDLLRFMLDNKRRSDPAFDATCKKVRKLLEAARKQP